MFALAVIFVAAVLWVMWFVWVLELCPPALTRVGSWVKTWFARSRGRLEAEQRAEALLREMLTEPEYRQLCRTGYLDVASPGRAGRVYRVSRATGRVLVVDDAYTIEQLCVQPAGVRLPEADVMLMHKLLIQSDEETYLRTANHLPCFWA